MKEVIKCIRSESIMSEQMLNSRRCETRTCKLDLRIRIRTLSSYGRTDIRCLRDSLFARSQLVRGLRTRLSSMGSCEVRALSAVIDRRSEQKGQQNQVKKL